MNNLEQKIKSKIKKQRQKARSIFVITDLARDVFVVILWIVVVILLGATIFLLKSTPWEIFGLPRFFLPALTGIPWELIALVTGLGLALYYLTINIATLYRNKGLLIVLMLISLLAGYFIAEASGLNKTLANISPVMQIYQRQGQLIAPKRGPHIAGEITHLEGNKFTLKDPTQTLWQVIVSEQTRILTEIRIGNTVMVVGNKKDNDIEADIVKPIQMRARPFMGSGLNGKVRGQNHQMY